MEVVPPFVSLQHDSSQQRTTAPSFVKIPQDLASKAFKFPVSFPCTIGKASIKHIHLLVIIKMALFSRPIFVAIMLASLQTLQSNEFMPVDFAGH